MRAPLSVVIPTLNAATHLPGCAATLFEGLEAGLIRELIVSDGGSDDATRKVAADLGAIWVEGPEGRGEQMRRGAEVAQGEWLLFLTPTTRLVPGWADVALRHLVSDRPACFRMASEGGLAARLSAGAANLRVRAGRPSSPGQGLLVPTLVWDTVVTDPPERALRRDLQVLEAFAQAAR